MLLKQKYYTKTIKELRNFVREQSYDVIKSGTFGASVGRDNGCDVNGLQLPEKYNKTLDVSNEGPPFTNCPTQDLSLKRRSSSCIFG